MCWTEDILNELLGGKRRTATQYAYDLRILGRYLRAQGQHVASLADVVRAVIGPCRDGQPAKTRQRMRAFTAWALQHGRQDGRGYSQSQVRRLQATFNRAMYLAVEAGHVGYQERVLLRLMEVPPARHRRRAKLSRQDVFAMLEICRQRQDTKGLRDELALWLMYANALRVGEVCSIEYPEGVDLAAGTVAVQPTGLHERVARDRHEVIELPVATAQLLARVLEARGSQPGPLLVSAARWQAGEPVGVTVAGLRDSIGRLASDAIGRRVTPADIRFAGIQAIGQLTRGNDLWVSILSRHRVYTGSGRTWQRYQDDPVYTMREAGEIVQRGRPWQHPSAR